MLKGKYIQKAKKKDSLYLIWVLAKTDFKLRYHGSFLGYVWAILKPLLIFSILNFVFSQIIARGAGIQNYPLQLITGIILWTFFAEGTLSGLQSLLSKGSIITKVYFPRWIVVVASTLNSLMIFFLNIFVLIGFYIYYGVYPSLLNILVALVLVVFIYILILSFAFLVSFLYLKYRDLLQIWEVFLQGLFYASPIIYPLSLMPHQFHRFILFNPIGRLIHYVKIVLIENRFPELGEVLIIFVLLMFLFGASYLFFNFNSKKVAEFI
ncbi:MAG: hypothetical protein GF347_00375 [Candidatus Moranbacteria bacterium]|nr:hypothetical protein [Candidatus Moranbacteria bacterium]